MGVVIKIGRKDPWRDMFCPKCHGSRFVLVSQDLRGAVVVCCGCSTALRVSRRAGELVRLTVLRAHSSQ